MRKYLAFTVGMMLCACAVIAQPAQQRLGAGGLGTDGPGHYPLAVSMALWANPASYGLASLALGPLLTFSEGHIPVGPPRGLAGAHFLPVIHGFGLALLTACAYGAIALGRAPFMVGAKLDVQFMTTATRYQYLGQLGVALLIGHAAAELANARSLRRLPAWLGPVLFGVGIPLAQPSYASSARSMDPLLDRRWLDDATA